MKTRVTLAVAIAFSTLAIAQAAPGPFAAVHPGGTTTYKIMMSSDDGTTQSLHSVAFTRIGPATFSISIDGAPGSVASASADGTLSVAPEVKKHISPLLMVAALMHGSPGQLEAGSTWNATLPVPVRGDTVRVPMTASVVQPGASATGISANGSAPTTIKHGIRSLAATVTVRCAFTRNAAGAVTQGSGTIAVTVNTALRGSKEVNANWSVTLVP